MWVKKSMGEIKRDSRADFSRRLNVIPPIIVAALLTGALALFELLGLSKSKGYTSAVPLSDWPSSIVESLPMLLGIFFLIAFIVYVFQLFRGPLSQTKSGMLLICTKCFKTQSITIGSICECGGPCEPIEKWNWVDGV